MSRIFQTVGAPLAAIAANEAGSAELISHAVELLAQIIIAIVALVSLLTRNRRQK